jgi:nitrogen fixation-related uncharacterized protein
MNNYIDFEFFIIIGAGLVGIIIILWAMQRKKD